MILFKENRLQFIRNCAYDGENSIIIHFSKLSNGLTLKLIMTKVTTKRSHSLEGPLDELHIMGAFLILKVI